ncbi:MAG: hypothetical protein LBU79_06145 [Planctomycetota bacterium]|jgi:hypothetical protein|nr:hypothetical protein [Planctomycetota bacterium]
MSCFRRLHLLLLCFFPTLLLSLAQTAAADTDPAAINEILVIRLDNVDNLDSSESSLARFITALRDGESYSPVRSLLGPALRNPFLTGLNVDAWVEGVILPHPTSENLFLIWTFPVEDQDAYLEALIRLGMTETGGDGESTRLSMIEADGEQQDYFIDWLPGNLAVFGISREAVRVVRQIYELAGASRGLLANRGRATYPPDLAVRFFPARFAALQGSEAGVYWWREQIGRLAEELSNYLDPAPPRRRLILSLFEDLASLPLSYSQLEASLWLGDDVIDWRLAVNASRSAPPGFGPEGKSELSSLRRLPEEATLSYALATDPAYLNYLTTLTSRILLGAAGGVVPLAAREAMSGLWERIRAANPRQAGLAWLNADPEHVAEGASRILLLEWEKPALLAGWGSSLLESLVSQPVIYALGEIGWQLELTEMPDPPGCYSLTVRPVNDAESPYLSVTLVVRASGPWVALAWGRPGPETAVRLDKRVTDVLAADGPGPPAARQVFTLMEREGAGSAFILFPVRLLSLFLGEAADWSNRPPDTDEPMSTRIAREMQGYRDAGAWYAVGTPDSDQYIWNGSLSWESLYAFAAALGLAETRDDRVSQDDEADDD